MSPSFEVWDRETTFYACGAGGRQSRERKREGDPQNFTDAELGEKLGHLGTGGGCRTLFVHSLADEYVPPHVDVPALAARFVAAAGGPATAEALLVPEASHSLATPPDVAAEHLFPAVDRLLRAVK